MVCPRCMKSDTSAITGSDHYVCNDPSCTDDHGNRTQFKVVVDSKVHFPFNQIFVNKTKEKFYRKPYLVLTDVGNVETQR